MKVESLSLLSMKTYANLLSIRFLLCFVFQLEPFVFCKRASDAHCYCCNKTKCSKASLFWFILILFCLLKSLWRTGFISEVEAFLFLMDHLLES